MAISMRALGVVFGFGTQASKFQAYYISFVFIFFFFSLSQWFSKEFSTTVDSTNVAIPGCYRDSFKKIVVNEIKNPIQKRLKISLQDTVHPPSFSHMSSSIWKRSPQMSTRYVLQTPLPPHKGSNSISMGSDYFVSPVYFGLLSSYDVLFGTQRTLKQKTEKYSSSVAKLNFFESLPKNFELPGQDYIFFPRFMFSPSLTKLSLKDLIIRQVNFLAYRNKGLSMIRNLLVVTVSGFCVLGLFRVLRAMRQYFENQKEMLLEEEMKLFGEYENPDATLLVQ